jgi:N-acyl-D-aspartate/D-glutamate deacylase
MLPFVGHGTLRYAVKGDDPAPLDSAERRRMTSLLEEAAAEGARGLSLGLIYVPALFADRRELHELLTAAGRLELPVTVHLRSESDEMLQALTEMIRLSRETGAYVHISHLKTIGGRNRYKMDEALRLIEGNGLSFDVYPYTYGSTSLLSLLPPQLLKGSSTDALLAGLESPRIAQRVLPYLRGQLRPKPGEPWDNLAQLAGWRGIDIVDIPAGPHAHLQGMTLAEAADALGRSPEETVLHLLARYSGAVRIVDRYTDEETVLKALLHPSGLFSTDTLLGGQPHPRSAGSFPRILRRYVFEHRMISPEEAVAKMSGRSAQVFGLPDRGILAPGKRADLVLFSSSIADRAEPGRPLAPATGVRHLFVRGRAVISDGELTGDLPGEFPG